jgi:hypothetical protein
VHAPLLQLLGEIKLFSTIDSAALKYIAANARNSADARAFAGSAGAKIATPSHEGAATKPMFLQGNNCECANDENLQQI